MEKVMIVLCFRNGISLFVYDAKRLNLQKNFY